MADKASNRGERLKQSALLNAITSSIWLSFKMVRRFEPRLKNSIKDFDAVIAFTTEDSVINMVFSDGNIKLSRKNLKADFVMHFLDMPGIVEQMKKDPSNMMRLMLENKIAKQGNNYYLLKFGFLSNLSERFFREKAAAFKSKMAFTHA